MAPRRARTASTPQAQYIKDTDNSDYETESHQQTPKPNNGRQLKKRLSEGLMPEHSGEGSSLNINDDAAEKRRRRKSAKISVVDNAVAGPSSEGGEENSGETSRAAAAKQKLASVAPTPVINVPFDVMSSNFEEWMKMATDNKINAANSWNFALIDYFHDMSLLRNNDDNSINFQRASCTLDGCVKIWTSRVDSVGTETGKLLSNLANEGREGDDDDGNASDTANGDPSQTRNNNNKRKTRRAEATLAKDPQQLKSKKLELDFSIDPLFKKTCADFDEGGAQGLLMNHLSLGFGGEGALRIIFDASDSVGVEEEEYEEEPDVEIDLSYLRKEFLPDLNVLEDKAICHSLADFAFSNDVLTLDDTSLYQHDTQLDLDDDNDDDFGIDENPPADPTSDANAPVAEDFFVGDHAVVDDFDPNVVVHGEDYGGDNASNGSVGPEGGAESGGPGATSGGATFVPFDPRQLPSERDLIMAMTDADAESGMMDYFDKNFMKNWAGPEHWKLRKVVRRPETDANGAAKTKGRREKKEAFKIDFIAPPDPYKDLKKLSTELFAEPTRGGINLPGTGPSKKGKRKGAKEKEREHDDHQLPDDMHFSSRQLVTLFLKPKFALKMRGHRVRFNENGDGEVDEGFWAQAAVSEACERTGNEAGEDADPIPFATQFFHDDYDDGPGFDDGDGEGFGEAPHDADAGEQEALATTEGKTRRVRPELVNYAKRAKRVDVRKLKENIWKGLGIVVRKAKGDEEMDVDGDSDTGLTHPQDGREFGAVINGLQKSYPRDKMAEISTSFCFICLLHLANEQGLRLDSSVGAEKDHEGGDMQEPEAKKSVGNIWELKVYRDPEATRAV